MAPIDKNSDEYKKKTSIHEDRTKPKTTEQLVKELEKKSFAQEIELDKNKSAVLIGRSEKSQELLASKPNDPCFKTRNGVSCCLQTSSHSTWVFRNSNKPS
jgi:hypothetical protein